MGHLYNNGATDYKIVLPELSSKIEDYAAEELSEIFGVAGVCIKTVRDNNESLAMGGKFIAIGKTKFFKELNFTLTVKEFKFDGYMIKSVGESYVIEGAGGMGVLFGCYGLMERLANYKYIAEDEIFIENSAVAKQLDVKASPSFYGRNAYSYDTLKDYKYALRIKTNGECFSAGGFSDYSTPWSSLNDQSLTTQILNYKKYKPLHPDWFYIKAGCESFAPPACYPQLCYSKALYDDKKGGMFDTLISNLINDYIIPEKTKSFFMLGMSDNFYFCDCENCKKEVVKYTKSGLSMRFVNKVADAVEKWRQQNAPERQIYLISFAYLSVFDAPVVVSGDKITPIDNSVVAKKNVIIQYAPIDANYMYPLMDKTHNKTAYEAITGWHAVAENLAVWDYRQDFASHAFLFPAFTVAEENLKTYKDFGFMDIFNQAQRFCKNSPLIYVDNYARSNVLWNADLSYSDLFEEGLALYYKEAAPAVKKYIEKTVALYKKMEARGYNGKCHFNALRKGGLYTLGELSDILSELENGFVLAEKNALYSEILKDRIKVLTIGVKFAMAYNFYGELGREKAKEILNDLKIICLKSGFNQFATRTRVETIFKEIELKI